MQRISNTFATEMRQNRDGPATMLRQAAPTAAVGGGTSRLEEWWVSWAENSTCVLGRQAPVIRGTEASIRFSPRPAN